MLTSKKALLGQFSRIAPENWYLLVIALFTWMGIAFGPFGSYLFEEVMIIPCVLFLQVMLCRPISGSAKKVMGLSLAMMGWFLFLQIMRKLLYLQVYPFSTYFCSYFFAFPLACLLQDGEKKQALKLFGIVFIAASLCHSFATLLLLLDWVPARLSEYHLFWDGDRLNPFWHPNMSACFLMFGIAFCIAFLQDAKKGRAKLGLLAVVLVLLATMALTNCRTVIILTGGILGGSAFYAILKGRWKLAPIALVVAVAILVMVYFGCGALYQANSDILVEHYIAEYLAEMETTSTDSELLPEEIKLETTSDQGTLLDDLTSLNSRTAIWKASFDALNANKLHYIFGVDYPGQHMSYFCYFFDTHTHNSWVETLLGMGIPGFVIAMVYTLITLWNGIVILLKHPLDVWKRTIAMVTLCMLAASFMEPYLFLPPLNYYLYNFIFLLCAGYLVHWQAEDNRKALAAVRKFLHI